MIPNHSTRPRILIVTPEVVFVPARTGNRIYYMGACSRCFSGFPAEFINDLLNLGVDVHVAQPDYRKLFEMLSQPNKPSRASSCRSIGFTLPKTGHFSIQNPSIPSMSGKILRSH